MADSRSSSNKAGQTEVLNRWLAILVTLYFFSILLIYIDKYKEQVLTHISWLFLLSVIPIFLFHKGSYAKLIGFSMVTYFGIMLAEVLSIKWLHYFGIVEYGPNLGWRLMGIPLVKGVLWFGLIYSCCMLVNNLKARTIYKAGVIGALMVVIDIIVERSASCKALSLWSYGYGQIPFTVYLFWGTAGAILGYYFVSTFAKTKNRFVIFYLFITLVFFLSFYFLLGI